MLFSPVFFQFFLYIYCQYNLILTSNSPFENPQLHQLLIKSSQIEDPYHMQSDILIIFFSYFFLFFWLYYADGNEQLGVFCPL